METTLSLICNVFFYIIIAILTNKLILIADDDGKPLPQEAQISFKYFCFIMSIFWPVVYVIYFISNIEDEPKAPEPTEVNEIDL